MFTVIKEIFLPSWKLSACDKSCSLMGRMKAPRTMSLTAKFPMKMLVTLLIFLFRMTTKMTRKLLMTAKTNMLAMAERKIPDAIVRVILETRVYCYKLTVWCFFSWRYCINNGRLLLPMELFCTVSFIYLGSKFRSIIQEHKYSRKS